MTQAKKVNKLSKEKKTQKREKAAKVAEPENSIDKKKELKRQNCMGGGTNEVVKKKPKMAATEPEITTKKTKVKKKKKESSEEIVLNKTQFVEKRITVATKTKKRRKHSKSETAMEDNVASTETKGTMPLRMPTKGNKNESDEHQSVIVSEYQQHAKKRKKNVNQPELHKTEAVDANEVVQKKKKRKKRSRGRNSEAKQEEAKESSVRRRNDAITYVQQWKKDRSNWSFKKGHQIWLLTHYHSAEELSDEEFAVFLEYIENMRGNARQVTIDKAQAAFEDNDTSEDVKERNRQVLQLLS